MLRTDPRHPQRITVLTAIVVLLVVVGAGLLIVATPGWSARELGVVVAVQRVENPVFDVVALTVAAVFGPVGAAMIVAIALVWAALLTRSWRIPVRLLTVIAAPWGCAEAIKLIVRRPRPDAAALPAMIVREPVSFSYPSGHTAFAAALVCGLILVMVPVHRRAVAIVPGAAVVLVTAWSRVYLGVHYPTDVAAAMLLVPVIVIAVERMTRGLAGPGTAVRFLEPSQSRSARVGRGGPP
jgi:membrane-associated phospholipid phosphatase